MVRPVLFSPDKSKTDPLRLKDSCGGFLHACRTGVQGNHSKDLRCVCHTGATLPLQAAMDQIAGSAAFRSRLRRVFAYLPHRRAKQLALGTIKTGLDGRLFCCFLNERAGRNDAYVYDG